jgi:Uma2 family endonuclease
MCQCGGRILSFNSSLDAAMGNLTSREALALRWAEVCNDPALRDLPYKIELNAFGKIEMSPANNRHALLQGHIAGAFSKQLRNGGVLTECPISTDIGVRVPDVAWASAAFLAKHGETTPYPEAPEICVEIRSPSNSDEEIEMKTRAYLAAGAVEVWIVTEDGDLAVFDRNGMRAATSFGVTLNLPARSFRH